MAHYKLVLKGKRGNVNTGFVDHVEYGGDAWGIITDNDGNELGRHCSSTLDWLEYDLLRQIEFDKNVDTYEKNW